MLWFVSSLWKFDLRVEFRVSSQASLWRESGHSYSTWQAKSTLQVLVRFSCRHGKVYSYPADKVSQESRVKSQQGNRTREDKYERPQVREGGRRTYGGSMLLDYHCFTNHVVDKMAITSAGERRGASDMVQAQTYDKEHGCHLGGTKEPLKVWRAFVFAAFATRCAGFMCAPAFCLFSGLSSAG